MAQRGGKIEKFWPKERFFLLNSGPLKFQATLTFMIKRLLADWGVSWTSSPGHWMDAERHMAHHWLTCMVEHWTYAALDCIRKNMKNYMGDLGIEPRSQYSLP